MQVSKIENGKYEVTNLTIRGYDWKLIRKPGIGTYAVIAGAGSDDDDEQVVIEEYSAPEMRKTWDSMSVIECAAAAHRELVKESI